MTARILTMTAIALALGTVPPVKAIFPEPKVEGGLISGVPAFGCTPRMDFITGIQEGARIRR